MASTGRTLAGITQRVVAVPSRGERRDTLDQTWASFIDACDLEAVAVPNRHPDPSGYLLRLGARGVILSGGGNVSPAIGTLSGKQPGVRATDVDLAPERDVTESALLRASMEHGWPVIGVCRGMQALNVFHGGTLAALAGHAGTRHALGPASPGPFDLDREVNSYHDVGIAPAGVAPGMRVLAIADGNAEAILHERVQHLGIMWHPERNRPFSAKDIALFRRFLGRDA
ncbi:MAG TPA: gamma-glutamyl-gamma-aminobutyrate hydrolase family protein [Burkholderiales bacterium]|nr:gamma-glutamyl-gamma-aminobutyrate hydrolase family protein [Burkholderiales bacterium]